MTNREKTPKKVSLEQIFPVMEEKLKAGGMVTFGPHGQSMLPLIREGKDTVTISAKIPAKVGDVAFYRRPDGQFVLHRIVGKKSDGFVLCGDNQTMLEKGVPKDWIIAVMTSVNRNGKEVLCKSLSYRFYAKVLLPLWKGKLLLRRFLRKMKRIIKGKK
ncbi:MAG: S24/S26 family peptidase [Clostridia bacterium]|nr:S24/S26 family peptidase [Clostridia bacterium]